MVSFLLLFLLDVQHGEGEVERSESGSLAYRGTSRRLASRETGKRRHRKQGCWVETVTGGGRRFTAASRKEKVDAAGHRSERKRGERD